MRNSFHGVSIITKKLPPSMSSLFEDTPDATFEAPHRCLNCKGLGSAGPLFNQFRNKVIMRKLFRPATAKITQTIIVGCCQRKSRVKRVAGTIHQLEEVGGRFQAFLFKINVNHG